MTIADRATRPARVLITEDHELVREGLRLMLSREADLEVVGEAENGQEAIEMCRSLSPDLVLMDVRMPEMDGIEATRKIKETQPEISVLIVTTYQDSDYLLEAVRAGAAGYILKEASRAQLLSAVRRTLSGENALNQELAMQLITRLSQDLGNGHEHSRERSHRSINGNPKAPEALTNILSNREIEVLRLIAAGKTNRQIAQTLIVSLSTVKTHVERIIRKLGVSDRTQASVRAMELGLIPDRSRVGK